jgi:hypothetical protein
MDIKGVCYDVGRAYSGYFLTRRVFDPATTRRELQIIRDDLYCNAVRFQGTDVGRLITAATDAGRHARTGPPASRRASAGRQRVQPSGRPGGRPRRHHRGAVAARAAARPGAVSGRPAGPRTSWLTDPDGYRIELVQWPPGHPDGISAGDFA